jgi:DNA helicase INO80
MMLMRFRMIGEGQFDDASADPSGAATPMSTDATGAPAAKKQRKNAAGMSKKAKAVKQRLAVIDGDV